MDSMMEKTELRTPRPLKRFVEPVRGLWPDLSQRARDNDSDIEESVKSILEEVRLGGDEALVALENRFDGTAFAAPSDVKVSEEEIQAAAAAVPEELKEAIEQAYSNIRKFHAAQAPASVDILTAPGVRCVQKAVPLRKVGLYVPGGRAPLFSTVLMLAVPAQVAGCPDIVLCTPPDRSGGANPVILFTAALCGVREIYKIGGAQAVAAMAFGTESLSKRDKIFGPGNRFVMKAKQLVSQSETAIDMPAGPSEVMVLADETAVPAFVASDFLSQSEHGPDSQSILVCTSERIADEVEQEIFRQTALLSRSEIVLKALRHSRIVVLKALDDIVSLANAYAAEHLIVSMAEPWSVAERIYAAGSIFIGNHSPESAGDYASGTNHTLPTSGWARSFSGLGLDAFMRKLTIQELTKEGLEGLGPTIRTMALAEGLDAHAAAVTVRLDHSAQGATGTGGRDR